MLKNEVFMKKSLMQSMSLIGALTLLVQFPISALEQQPLVGPAPAHRDLVYQKVCAQASTFIPDAVAGVLRAQDTIAALTSLSVAMNNNPGANEIEQEQYQRVRAELLARAAYDDLYTLSSAIKETLDTLETASLYCQWCTEHPFRYTLSKSPTSWWGQSSQAGELRKKQGHIQELLCLYNEQYGSLVRHQGHFELCSSYQERLVWVEKAIAILVGCMVNEMTNQYASLANNPPDVATMDTLRTIVRTQIDSMHNEVRPLAVPSHWMRNWLPYTVAGIGLIAAGIVCAKNATAIQDGAEKLLAGAHNGLEYCTEPLSKLKKTLFGVLWPHESDNSTPLAESNRLMDETIESLTIAQKHLTRAGYKPEQSWLPGRLGGAVNTINDAGASGAEAIGATKAWVKAIQCSLNYFNPKIDRVLEGNAMVLALGPATFGLYGLYKTAGALKHWYTKRDRQMLRLYLCQTQDIFIRSNGKLSDEEYGKLLYTLGKEDEQLSKNVSQKEQGMFRADLRYIASPHSDVQQKKETVANMWRKYHALQDA
jgi:hypothetical protein